MRDVFAYIQLTILKVLSFIFFATLLLTGVACKPILDNAVPGCDSSGKSDDKNPHCTTTPTPTPAPSATPTATPTAHPTATPSATPVVAHFDKWASELPSAHYSIALDSAGNIYAAGTTTVVASGILIKLDSSGTVQWTETFPCLALSALTIDSINNIFIVGNVNGGSCNLGNSVTVGGYYDVPFLAKFNSAGVAQWAVAPSMNNDLGGYSSVALDLNGNIYVSGDVGQGGYNFGNGISFTISDNNPHFIVVKYNSSGVAQWAQVPANNGSSGSSFAMNVALDPQGNVYAAATMGVGSTTFGNGVTLSATAISNTEAVGFLVKFNSSGVAQWIESIGKTVPYFERVAVDNSGNAYVVTYASGMLLKYNPQGALQWARTGVPTTGPLTYDSLAVDNGSNVYVVGLQKSGNTDFGNGITDTGAFSDDNLTVVKFDPTGAAQVAQSTYSATAVSGFWGASVDKLGNAFAVGYLGTGSVSYGNNSATCSTSNTYCAVLVKYAFGSTWSGTASVTAGTADGESIVIAPNGIPYVAYQDGANGSGVTVLKYNGTAWATVGTPGFSGSTVNNTSLAFDSSGNPYVAFTDDARNQKASVMKFNGTSWVNVGVAGFSAGAAAGISLAINSSGVPYVAYRDGGNGFGATVMKFNGTSWVTVGAAGLSSNLPNGVALAIDPSGAPYIAYEDSLTNGQKATVMKFNGSAWVNVGNADFTSGLGAPVSLAIDSHGTPYVAFCLSGANVMKFDGANWVNVGNANFTPGAGAIKLAMTSNGSPYVVFSDYSNGEAITVMKFDGYSWSDVGLPGFSAGAANYPAIAIDSNGNPYVAYQDVANGNQLSAMVYH